MMSIKNIYFKALNKALTHKLLKNLKPQYKKQNAIFVFSSRRKLSFYNKLGFHAKLYAIVAYELNKRGYNSYFLFHDNLVGNHFPALKINGFNITNSIIETVPLISYHSHLVFEHKNRIDIDIKHKKILVGGFNFFCEIENTLRAIEKKYNIDYTVTLTRSNLNKLIQSCDLLLSYFLLLIEYSIENNIKIILVGWESSYIPNAIFKRLCTIFKDKVNLEYMDLNRSYVHYFEPELINTNYVCASNLTKNNVNSRIQLTKMELNEIKPDTSMISHYSGSISKALNKKILKTNDDRLMHIKKSLEYELKCYQESGRAVFVLFSHLFYDIAENDSSPSFVNMCDWVKETVEFFSSSNHFLILKPHPAEQIKNPSENLESFLEKENLNCFKNIKLLDPTLFTLKELSQYISCGLIWRSSVALELTYLRIPCIIAGIPPYKILNLNYSKNKQDYFHMISNYNNLRFEDNLVNDVIRYVYCLEKKSMNQIKQISKNGMWDKRELKKYICYGDKKTKQFIDSILSESL